MDKPTQVTINNKIMYKADELYQYDKAYFYGCSRVRTIIKKKNISTNDYLFAYKKDGKWIISQSDYRKSKLYLLEEWVTKNIPKMMDNKDTNNYKYEEAPHILLLIDAEKLKDKNGKILDIEIRGEKNHKNIYFKCKDIGEAFKMPQLNNILTNNNTRYKKELHYKIFIIDDIKQAIKTLFLTYSGLRKCINVSRQNFDSQTLFIMNKWLQQFDETIIDNYNIDINEDKNNNIGCVYCITSPLINYIKIGFWTGSLKGLECRYKTYYGNELDINTFYTKNPYLLEQQTHKYFNQHKITNELFKKEYLADYCKYIDNNIIDL